MQALHRRVAGAGSLALVSLRMTVSERPKPPERLSPGVNAMNRCRPEQVVSRILFPHRVPPQRATIIHLRMPVARHLVQPTRGLGRATLKRPSIWSCTGWGLPSFPGHPGNWCALTAPFHPYRRGPAPEGWPSTAVCFLLHFPSCRHDSMLWSTLPCGVRTFLRSTATGDRLTYSDRLWSSSQ